MQKGKYVLLFLFVLVASGLLAGVLRDGVRGQEGEPAADEALAAEAEAILAGIRPDPDDAWRAGRALEALGVGAAPALLAKWKELEPVPRVAVGWALARLGHRETVVAETVEAVRAEKDGPVRALQARLLRAAATGADAEKIEGLLDVVFEPDVKIPLCQALFEISGNIRGKTELKAFLESESESVRIAAAVALAEIGDVAPGKRILRKLADEPTERGRLARSLLREYDLKRMLERTQFEGPGDLKETFEDPILDELRQTIQKFYVDAPKTPFTRLAGEAAAGIAAHLDPYSAYIRAETARDLARLVAGETAGVGLSLSFNPRTEDGQPIRPVPVVVAPLWGGPATRAGIETMDELFEVDGKNIIGKTLPELEALLAGRPGSRVTLTLFRKGGLRERKVVLVREKTATPPVLAETLPGGILYFKLPALTLETSAAFADGMKKAGESKGVLLDLRDNPGGALEAAVDLAGAFLDKGAVVYTLQARNPALFPATEARVSAENPSALPIVVLVNQGTSGSAELLAGALKDHGRARLVGTPTFGNARVLKRFPLQSSERKTLLQLTVARTRLPKTGAYDGKGVEPDRAVVIRPIEIWRQDEIAKVVEAGQLPKYLDAHLPADEDALRALARADAGEAGKWPGFAEWFRATGTKAEPEDLRALLRAAVRRHFAGKGETFLTDLQEDETLQAAVAALASDAGIRLADVPEYAPFAAKFK